jgi:hypothetical protein
VLLRSVQTCGSSRKELQTDANARPVPDVREDVSVSKSKDILLDEVLHHVRQVSGDD